MLIYNVIDKMEESEIFKLLNIDKELFSSDDPVILLYLFPLIERLVVEILSLKNLINIEINKQGTFRTLNSILNSLNELDFFEVDILEKLKEYYKEDGLRNTILHFNPNLQNLEIDDNKINEIKKIAISLMEKYNGEMSKIDNLEDIIIEEL